MKWLQTALAALLVLVGFTGQNVTIVYWTQTSISNFGILMLCGMAFFVIFGIALLAWAVYHKDWEALKPSDDPEECRVFVSPWRRGQFQLTHLQILCCVGLLNAFNGYLIVYASPPDRTPPLVQAVLQNAGVLWAVPFSKFVLGDRKKYSSWEPLLAALIIVASVAVSLAPTIAGGTGGEFNGATSAAWCIIYLMGLAPGAAYNVFQQLYFIRSGVLVEGVSFHTQLRYMLRALFWSNVAQPLSMLAFFWLDVLPFFGTSTDINDFSANTAFSLGCSIGGPGLAPASDVPCGARTAVWAWAFIGMYVLAYLGAAQLNRESAAFSMLVLTLVTMTTAAFWLIPGTNPNPSGTPLWSVLTSLALSLAGSILWKRWETRTPADEQFALSASVAKHFMGDMGGEEEDGYAYALGGSGEDGVGARLLVGGGSSGYVADTTAGRQAAAARKNMYERL